MFAAPIIWVIPMFDAAKVYTSLHIYKESSDAISSFGFGTIL